MRIALEEAQKSFLADEVPVGALLVKEGKILARAHNVVERKKDATAHAEIEVIREATKILDDWRLVNTTLYVTLEPCLMCMGATILSRIKKIVWGCKDPRHGASESLIDIQALSHPIHTVEIVSGLMAEESKELMQKFFRKKREEKRGKGIRRAHCLPEEKAAPISAGH